jgi:CBS domain-containing protein
MKSVQEIMSKNIVWSTPDASLSDIAKMMVDCDCGEIPLVESSSNKNIVGVITDRDIVCRSLAVGKNPMELKAKDCMTSNVVTGDLDMSLSDCVDIMEENQVRRLPIVDEKGQFCGIVSQADVFRNLEDDAEGVELVERVSRPSDSASQPAAH